MHVPDMEYNIGMISCEMKIATVGGILAKSIRSVNKNNYIICIL